MTQRETGDSHEIGQTWDAISRPGEVREIRCLHVDSGSGFTHTEAGFFDNREAVIAALGKVRRAQGIYFTLNPVLPALLSRINNRLKKVGKGEGTTDADVVTRTWMPIDIDPKRPAGIASSEGEHYAALAKARVVAEYLRGLGWPSGIMADSGNGAHLLYRIDLPVDDGGLVKRTLEDLAARFNDGVVAIDTVNHNPSRIWKLYGTMARKGDNTMDRPHRLSRTLSRVVDGVVTLSAPEALPETVAAPTAKPAMGGTMEGWIRRMGLDVTGPTANARGDRSWTLRECPFNAQHCNGEVGLVERADGKLGFHCFHNSCASNDWHALRDRFEPRQTEEAPVRIEFASSGLPPFPTHILPPVVRDYVKAVSAALETPEDMAAMFALGCIAAATAKKYVVRLGPDWVEPTNLYIAIAMEPGERKSPVFNLMCGHLLDWERQALKKRAGIMAAAETRKKILQAKLEKAQQEATRSGRSYNDEQNPRYEAEDLAEQLADFEMPVSARIVAADITPERLASLMADAGGRMALLSPEGGGPFGMMAGRYQSAGMANLEIYLQSYGDKFYTTDRKKDGNAHVSIQDPRLTIATSVQPSVLRAMAENPQLRGRGLLGRFDFSMPTSQMGARRGSAPRIPEHVKVAWTNLMTVLLEEAVPECVPRELSLDERAAAGHLGAQTAMEPRLGRLGDLHPQRDWASKWAGKIGRVAGGLHVAAEGGFGYGVISGATMEAAIEYGHYTIPHACASFAEMDAAPGEEAAKHILDWAEQTGTDEFSRRDVHIKFRRRFKTADEIQGPLALLVDRGLLTVKHPPSTGGRPPLPRYSIAK